ncbi:unnamed protein product [Didymodactylos carnosus]|uniref:Helix-turn-helix domain-containing protein n=1 Tax=Didymodactylos carnosus TaxID=1234261 RepID=A0A815D743_9BILA|nr:unnamed protein product [Didymodactylos carnosus]CAF4105322.1 unnamed protein product [Didymodactylos carnosus]
MLLSSNVRCDSRDRDRNSPLCFHCDRDRDREQKDLHMENRDDIFFTSVYHKPSYEPYYLPFHSIHPLHMKQNIPFTMFLRRTRYCSTFQSFIQERDHLRMALLLNEYPIKFIDQRFNRVFEKFNIIQPLTSINYSRFIKLTSQTTVIQKTKKYYRPLRCL